MDDQDNVIDGQVVDDASAASQVQNANQAEVLISLEQLIKSHITSIDKLRNDLKTQKQMLDDVYINDAVYKQNQEKSKEAAKVASTTKAQISRQPSVSAMSVKIKQMSTDLKDKQNALSDYLLEFQRMAGVNEIEGEDGEVRDIINLAKLKKRYAPEKKK